jgi:hypothetical protein
MIAQGYDSDVEVIHRQDDVYVIKWKDYSTVVFSLPEAVLFLDTVQGQGAKIPWRFMQDIAIKAISKLMENQDDNLKEE